MTPKQEFLVLDQGGSLAIYAPSQFPIGTPIGRDARRLGVAGPSLVRPPRIHMTEPELEGWRRQIEADGYEVKVGPFWTDPDMLEKSTEAIRRGEFLSLEEFRDELCGRGGGPSREEARRLEPVEPPPA